MSQPYKKLFTYWYSVLIYDLTVKFCKLFIKSYKLKEQMNGAARSGKQNIVEASANLKTSLKIAIKLTNISNGSLEELIGDLEDFTRQKGLSQWDKNDPRIKLIRAKSANIVRNLSNLRNLRDSAKQNKKKFLLEKLKLPKDKEKAVNLLLTLCHQATYLLSRQVKSLEEKHRKEGGYTEKLYRKRKKYRGY